MDENHFRNLPIVDKDGRLLGNMTHQAIIRYLADRYPVEVLNRPIDPELFPRRAEGGITHMTDNLTENTQEIEELESVAIRFAGDSGDGMQLAGTQFTTTSAVFGNDISTMPDFPAEIRAPAGTLAGVSGFQVHFSSQMC